MNDGVDTAIREDGGAETVRAPDLPDSKHSPGFFIAFGDEPPGASKVLPTFRLEREGRLWRAVLVSPSFFGPISRRFELNEAELRDIIRDTAAAADRCACVLVIPPAADTVAGVLREICAQVGMAELSEEELGLGNPGSGRRLMSATFDLASHVELRPDAVVRIAFRPTDDGDKTRVVLYDRHGDLRELGVLTYPIPASIARLAETERFIVETVGLGRKQDGGPYQVLFFEIPTDIDSILRNMLRHAPL